MSGRKGLALLDLELVEVGRSEAELWPALLLQFTELGTLLIGQPQLFDDIGTPKRL